MNKYRDLPKEDFVKKMMIERPEKYTK
jgi:hypothetical protein